MLDEHSVRGGASPDCDRVSYGAVWPQIARSILVLVLLLPLVITEASSRGSQRGDHGARECFSA